MKQFRPYFIVEETTCWDYCINCIYKWHGSHREWSRGKESTARILAYRSILGSLKYFLRIEVSRSNNGIFLSQWEYTLDLLHETGMLACQPIETPTKERLKLGIESNQVLVDKGRYQRLVGRLMYLTHIRLDLAYALSTVNQFMHNPREQHMRAVMHILWYLKSAPR